jgi:hypothetical protein
MNPASIILGIIIVILIYVLYKYFTNDSTTLGALIDLSTTSETNALITKDKIKNSTSARYSYGIWLYVNTWETLNEKNVFYRKNGTDPNIYDIRLYLDQSAPSLKCDFYTTKKETVTITNNFPIQKWVYIVVSVDSTLVDTYLDGKLITSQQLTGIPKVSDTDIFIGNFKAYADKFERWTTPMDPQTVWKNYMAGNGGSTITKMFSSYGIDITFKKDNVEQQKFKLL